MVRIVGLWESYDLVSLPDPDTSNTNNMGLALDMSWLGAQVRWGTPRVDSPTGSDNEAPDGPYNSNKDSWVEPEVFQRRIYSR